MTTPTIPTLPPDLRGDDGLVKGLDHPRKPDGSVDWRKMILPQHLYVSPDYQQEVMVRQNVKTKWDIDVSKCEDKELLITLNGLKYLARLRGLLSVRPSDLHVSPTEVTSVCTLEFSPNFENPDGLIVGAQASASVYSVSGKFQLYLAAMAQNRAFTRACKDALGIEILGFEEVDFKASKAFEESLKKGENPLVAGVVQVASEPTSEESYTPDPWGLLQQRCDKNKISFETLKARAIEYRAELSYAMALAAGDKMSEAFDPVNWTGVNKESISMGDALTLIDKIDAATKSKKKEKKT